LLASTIVAFCVCLESGARIYLCHFASDAIFLRYASLSQLEDRVSQGRSAFVKKTFHRYLGYNLTPNFRSGLNRHNSLGYRGDEIEIPKPADEFRIVCLGGSTTYTSGVADYRLSYPELLEHDLQQRGYQKVNVINAGVPGWTTWECLINFQFRILDMQPDMIIVYEAINDIHTRLVWPPAAYQGDNSGTSIPAVSSIFMPSIFEYSTVIRFFLVRAGVTQPHADITKTIDRRAPTFYADNFQRQKIQQTYPSGVFKKTSAQQMLETNKPVYYRRNIENILLIARARAITPVVATFAYSPLFENEPRVASPEYIFAYEEMNELLKSIATESVANLFDFGSKFPTDKKYYHDGRHVNEEGARLMAKMFADYLVESHLLPGTLLRRDIISTQHLN
jgi:lysophospholipase L1-like esterase